MKNKLLALCFLCIAAWSLSAQSAEEVGDINNDSFCEYDGKSYPIGSSLITKDKAIFMCKTYDAIIPKSADRLVKGYTYWAKQIETTNTSIEIPRIFFSAPQPSLIAKSNP